MPSSVFNRAHLNDVEELSDRFLHRPLAHPLVRLLLPTPVTPDQVTLMSGLTGVLAAVSLALGVDRPSLRLVSAALLLGATVFDCADGQFARARRTMSPRGMALDAGADIVVGFSMVLAATYFVVRLYASPGFWILAPIVLTSYGIQCFLFDVVKERYLADHRIDYASSKAVHADQTRARGAMDRLFDLYWWAAGPMIRQSRNVVLDRGYLRAWTLLGPGTHMTCLYVAAALSYAWPPALYACLLVFALVMNVLLLGLFAANLSPVRA